MRALEFIFSSFWIWLGTMFLISAPFWGIAQIFSAAFCNDTSLIDIDMGGSK